jgi:Flp pilus assembly pilin Flp
MLSYLIWVLETRSKGQGLAEYALILGLIAVTAIAALMFMGTRVSAILSTISNKL